MNILLLQMAEVKVLLFPRTNFEECPPLDYQCPLRKSILLFCI